MEDLPPLPSSRNSSRAPSRQLSHPDLNESHLYIRDFVRETRQRLNFTSVQLPLLGDSQLSELSDGEMILVPLSCSALNALASMTRQLDTITTQLGNIQQAVHTMLTWPALQGALDAINAAIRDLSHRVTSPMPPAPAPTRPPIPQSNATTRPPVPPSGATTHSAPMMPPLLAKPRPPPSNKGPSSSFDLDIPRYDPDTRCFYGNPRACAVKFPDPWEANAFREGKYPDPTTFIAGHLAPDYSKPQQSYAKVASGAPKGKKNKSSLTAAKVASASNVVPDPQPPKSLPTAKRRFYAPRSSPSEHPQASLIAATFPDIAARILRDANCILPLAVPTKVNDSGSVTLLVTDPATPAAAFAPYFDVLSSQLNKSFPWESLPGCSSTSPPTRPNSPSTPSPSHSFLRTLRIFSPASRSPSSTPKTYVSSPPDISTRTHNQGRGSLPPPSSFPSTQGMSRRWAPRSACSPAQGRLSVHTLPIGTSCARTGGDLAMSPPDAPLPDPSALSVPSTTPVPCTNAPTPPALEVATLRLLLAVALPYHRGAPTAKGPTLRRTGVVTPDRFRHLSGVPLLPKRLFSHHPLVTKWTRPPTKMTSRLPLHPPALSSRRSRWLLQEPEAQRYFRPLSHEQKPIGPGPLMQYNHTSWGGEQASPRPPKPFTLVQHNCLGSWDVFLSLFGSFTQLSHPPSIVALQDPPVYRGKLPSFNSFTVFSPPTDSGCKPRVAFYVNSSFLARVSLLPRFFGRGDVMGLDLITPDGFFNPSTTGFTIINSYGTKGRLNNTRSVPPDIIFPASPLPTLTLGDLNIHHPTADPLRVFKEDEIATSSPYFARATELGLSRLNVPGVFTRFSMSLIGRPGVLDLAFACPLLATYFSEWSDPLPSTGSDHIPILLRLEAPLFAHPPLPPTGP